MLRTYKVFYRAGNGKVTSFKFATDRSFAVYSNYYGGGFWGLGTPFCTDMMRKVNEIMARPESAMKRNGGFSHDKLLEIKCLDTGEFRVFQ